MGDRARRDPADAAGQRTAGPHRGPGGRAAQDGPRRADRGAARRGGVRLRHGAARCLGLHHDACLPPRHLPRRDRDPEPRAAGQVQRQTRVRPDVLRIHRRGGARAPRVARPALARRSHRAGGPARHRDGGDALEGRRAGPLHRARPARRPGHRRAAPDEAAGPRLGEGTRPRLPGPVRTGAGRRRSRRR